MLNHISDPNVSLATNASLDPLPAQASYFFGRTSAGQAMNLVAPPGTSIRRDKTVTDIGTVLAVSFYQSMVARSVAVPAALSYAFDSELSPLALGLVESPAASRLRATLVLEALRRTLIDSGTGGTQLVQADMSALAQNYGLKASDLLEIVSRTASKMATLIQDKQTVSMLTMLSDAKVIEAYGSLFTLPNIAWEDCVRAHTKFGQVYAGLLSRVDLLSLDVDLESAMSDIPVLDHIRQMLTVKQYSALPLLPMSMASLLSMVGQSGPDAQIQTPYISRASEGDSEPGRPGQFKFWTLFGDAFYNKIYINDVLQTIAEIDKALFGLRAGSVSLENYMTFAVQSGRFSKVPQLPVAGRLLTSDPAMSAILSVTGFSNAMSQVGSPQIAAVTNALSSYKLDANTTAIMPSLILKIQSLAILADIIPQVRSLFISLLDKSDGVSFLCSNAAELDTDMSSGAGVIQLNETQYPANTMSWKADAGNSTMVTDTEGIEKIGKKRGKSAKGLTSIADSNESLTGETSIFILNRSVFDRYYELYNKALEPLMESPADPSTVRSIFEPAHLLTRPAAFRLSFDLSNALVLAPWFSRVQGGAGIDLVSLPLPYILDGKVRVFGSGPAGPAYGDSHAQVLGMHLLPTGATHYTIPFFTLPDSSSITGPLDLTGLTSLIPTETLKRLAERKAESPIANAIATLISTWQKGYVSTGLSAIQTAAFLRSASLLRVSGPDKIFNLWPNLYTALSIPSTGILTGVEHMTLAVSSFSIQVDPAPVILVPNYAANRVERAELTGPNFSFPGPLVVMHPYASDALASLDANPLLSPPESLQQPPGTPVLVEDHRKHGIDNDKVSSAPSHPSSVTPLVTNVGVGQMGDKKDSDVESSPIGGSEDEDKDKG